MRSEDTKKPGLKHPVECDCWECRTGWEETIAGYERCIKHHQKYIDEFHARIDLIRKENRTE